MTDVLEVETWEDLARQIMALPEEQRRQPIQCCVAPADDMEPAEMLYGVALGTVEQLEFPGERSIYDNKYHADDVALLIDYSLFAKGGAIAYKWTDAREIPIYGLSGPTDKKDQMAPGWEA